MKFSATKIAMHRCKRRNLQQFIRVMKLTTLLMIIVLAQVSAKGFGQKITLNEKNVPLKQIIQSIEQQSGYTFFYDTKDLPNVNVNVDINKATVEEALTASLKNLPLVYKIVKNNIVLTKADVKPVNQAALPAISVHGFVIDELNKPMPNVTIRVKDGNQTTITDTKGEFTFKQVDEKAVLVISFIGYLTKEVNANSDLGRIKMEVSNSKLDEIQIQAYGTTSERLNTGDITTIKAADIAKSPVSNPLLALQGRVPGLVITQATGFSGSGVTVRIQGQNSMIRGNDPLYVIDGVPYVSQLLPDLNTILGGSGPSPSDVATTGQGNPLSFINSADIESIDVLKDADATSIYGSRAANGAILITTKKGKIGQTKVDVNLQDGYGEVSHFADLLNLTQYLQMRHEAIANDHVTPAPTDYDINGTWDTTRSTNWQKVLIGGMAKYKDFQGTVSGGSGTTSFLVGAGYHKETTVFPGDANDQKASIHFNINNVSLNQKFKLQFTGSYLLDDNQIPSVDLTNQAEQLAPDAPNLYNPDGSLNWAPLANGTSTWNNPLSFESNGYNVKTNNLVSNAVVSYKILPGLELKSSFGYTNMQTNELSTGTLAALAPELRPTSTPNASYAHSYINSWSIEPQINYNVVLGIGKLDALLGSTFEDRNTYNDRIYGGGYGSDLVLQDPHAAATLTSPFATVDEIYKYDAIFGRLNYNIDDKYIVNVSGRRDGSSRFGSDSQLHDFYSVAGAWIFSSEDAVKKNASFLSFGKLRASYGTTGNDQIGDYQFLDLYSAPFGPPPYQGATGLTPTQLANPLLQWEETSKLQFGLDLGFFKDRILFNTDYFRNRSSNELGNYGLPIITGFYSITRNVAATVQNSGWEFTLNTANIKGNGFNWSTSINLTVPSNKLVAYPGINNSSAAGNEIIGKPLSTQYLVHLIGVDPTTGTYIFQGANGKPESFPNLATDRTVAINTDPKFYGGFQNSFSYKGFQLDVLFQFVKQIGKNTSLGFFRPGSFNPNSGNEPAAVLNAWHKPGDVATVQRYSQDFSLYLQNYYASYYTDAGYSDASYIRLKNMSLSWSIPQTWRDKLKLQNARLYVQGQNVLTFTHYKGLDPETQNPFTLPPLRMITFGVQVGI